MRIQKADAANTCTIIYRGRLNKMKTSKSISGKCGLSARKNENWLYEENQQLFNWKLALWIPISLTIRIFHGRDGALSQQMGNHWHYPQVTRWDFQFWMFYVEAWVQVNAVSHG